MGLDNLCPIWDVINTKYQTVRFYENEKKELVFTLNTFIQFVEGEDERIYHDILTSPAFAANPTAQKFLILGGGDGLVARNIFRLNPGADVVLVELDGDVVNLFKSHPRLVELNEDSLPKCRVYIEDALYWVPRNQGKRFDVIILDFPDPNGKDLKKLYDIYFYELIVHLLEENGILAIQCHDDVAESVAWKVKEILGNSASLPYSMPYLDGGVIVLGKK